MRFALLLVALVGCARETPPNKQEPVTPKPTMTAPPPSSCVDPAKASQQVTAAEERKRAAFAKQLADRGLEHVSLPLQQIAATPPAQLMPVQTPSTKQGGKLITTCHMMTGCCSETVDPQSVHCMDGSSDPALYKNAKGELFVVRDLAHLNHQVVTACGVAPPPQCNGGCGCPTQMMGTYVEIPPDLTYAGVLELAYDVDDVVVTYERPSPVPGCPAVP